MYARAVQAVKDAAVGSLGSSVTMAKNMNALIGGGLCTPQAIRDPKQLVYKAIILQLSPDPFSVRFCASSGQTC